MHDIMIIMRHSFWVLKVGVGVAKLQNRVTRRDTSFSLVQSYWSSHTGPENWFETTF